MGHAGNLVGVNVSSVRSLNEANADREALVGGSLVTNYGVSVYAAGVATLPQPLHHSGSRESMASVHRNPAQCSPDRRTPTGPATPGQAPLQE